tara:strand:- start:142 stop:438 length:297 start_codon:yes stop_codon:yes gene_type:complete
MTNKVEAILSLKPGAKWLIDNDILIWKDESKTEPTESEINAEIARLDQVYIDEKYKRDRASAYPSIQDQLDMQYWDQVNSTTTWKDAIAKVKSDYPKP